MEDLIFGPILAFANHVDIVHVLVLNLIGWMTKGCMWHSKRFNNWTDVIPLELGLLGIALVYIDPTQTHHHAVIQGLANAGLAWLLHQGVKRTQQQIQQIKDRKKTNGEKGQESK